MWFIWALLNGISMSFSNIFTKLATGKVSPLVGAAVTVLTATVLLFALVLLQGKFPTSISALIFPALAGVATAIGFFAWFSMFASGASLSTGAIVAILGVIALTAVWGVVFFGEKLTLIKSIGILLALISAFLLTR